MLGKLSLVRIAAVDTRGSGRPFAREHTQVCCQTNSNQSQIAVDCVNLRGTKLLPLGKCCGSVELEVVARVEVTLLVEVIVDRGVNRRELLQALHSSKAQHCMFSSPKGKVGIFCTIVPPSTRVLATGVSHDLHCCTI